MRDHFIRRLLELAQDDPRIMLITGDLGFGVLDKFRDTLTRQFINAGVAEQNMTAIATGLAMEGYIVFTYSIANFPILRCLEQIRNDACYHNANVKIVAIGAGFSYGSLGISHHATEDLSIMRSLPEITVLSPCGFWEAEEATEALINQQGTCYLRLDKSAGDDSFDLSGEDFKIGKARVLQEGSDCTIIVTGGILEEVWKARDLLKEQGIDVRIVSMHTIKPIDEKSILESASKTGAIITVEEHSVHGGLGGAVAETLLSRGVHPKVFLRIGLEDGFSCIVGSQKFLRKSYRLDAEAISVRIRTAIERTTTQI